MPGLMNGSRIRICRYALVVMEGCKGVISVDIWKEYLDDLSQHFYFGGDIENAIKYSILAGDKVKDSYVYREAVEIDAASQIMGIGISIMSLDFEEDRLEGLGEGLTEILQSPEESVSRNLKAAAHQLAGRLYRWIQ